MAIIDQTDFIGEINIPNLDQPGVAQDLNHFIKKYQHKYLKAVLGDNFAAEFEAGLLMNPVPQNWSDLSDLPELKEAIANYVYCFWATNSVTSTTGTGEVSPVNENSRPVQPTRKLVRAWNEMVKDNIYVCKWLNENKSNYPTWPTTGMETWHLAGTLYGYNAVKTDMFRFKNSLGI